MTQLTGAERAEHKDRLSDAHYVINGGEGGSSLKSVLYGLYLIGIFGVVYGFTAIRAALTSVDPAAIDGVLGSWWSIAAGFALVAGGVLAGFRLGRIRGPIAPQLPYVDQVVGSDLDRALTLRAALWSRAGGFAGGGAIIGLLVAGAVLAAHRGAPPVLALGLLLGAFVGLLLAASWLAGQVSLGERPSVHPVQALRALRAEDLRRAAIRTTHMGGALLAGDLRAVRLDVAAPVTRARSVRLRPGGVAATLVRRDLLGLRRTPGTVVPGLVALALSSAVIAASLAEHVIPAVVPMLAMATAYLGVGALADGLRQVGDNAGTPPLLGIGFRTEAVYHLVVPGLVAWLVIAAAGSLVTLAMGGSLPLWLAWSAALTVLLLGATMVAAFRGAPPDVSFMPEFGPIAMINWYARPIVLSTLSGGLLVARGGDAAAGLIPQAGPAAQWIVLIPAVLAGLAVVGFGLYSARKVEMAHRI